MFAGAIGVNADSFREGNSPRLFTDFGCTGNETDLLECNKTTFTGFVCTTAGVVCQGIYVCVCMLYIYIYIY